VVVRAHRQEVRLRPQGLRRPQAVTGRLGECSGQPKELRPKRKEGILKPAILAESNRKAAGRNLKKVFRGKRGNLSQNEVFLLKYLENFSLKRGNFGLKRGNLAEIEHF